MSALATTTNKSVKPRLTKAKSDVPILKRERFRGAIVVDGQQVEVRFALFAGSDCRLKFEVDPVDAKSFMLLQKTSARPGLSGRFFSITARSRTGKTIQSDTMSMAGYRHNNDGLKVAVVCAEATLKVPLDTAARQPLLKLWFRGFASFRTAPIPTTLGEVFISGATRHGAADEMTGYVAIASPSVTPDAEWHEQAERLLRHMQLGLAFAAGGRLQTPRLDSVDGNVAVFTFYGGSGSRPELAVVHHLHLGPIVEALAKRFFEHGPLSEVLWTALGWMHVETSFDEVRFLTAMTALETIIESLLPVRKGTMLPKPTFKVLKNRLENVLVADTSLRPEQRAFFKAKIEMINKKSLATQMDALFDHYKVSRDGFDSKTISSLIKLRNNLVHRGSSPPSDVDPWKGTVLVRELITRIVLSEIGFKGRYICYINGQQDRDFP